VPKFAEPSSAYVFTPVVRLTAIVYRPCPCQDGPAVVVVGGWLEVGAVGAVADSDTWPRSV
jgi:hypothetical protein